MPLTPEEATDLLSQKLNTDSNKLGENTATSEKTNSVKEDVKPKKEKQARANNYKKQIPAKTEKKNTVAPVENRQNQNGEQSMPQPKSDEQTKSYELQPESSITPESLSGLSSSNPSDPTLTLLLAILAVVGGGAAWKFYTQYSEQKHDQKMKQMELDAKAQGLSGAQPPPCQAANLKLETEIKEIKGRLGKLDQKLALNADFDGDLLDRKVKKIERRLRDLEEKE